MALKEDFQNSNKAHIEFYLLRNDMKMMEQRIVLKMGVMIVAAVGFMSALFTLVR